jgi:MerR family transcriptional regulator/heat shock protein HspR
MRRPRDYHEPVYRIGVAAKLCGVHPQTLRAYERQGLISPRREKRKNRLYSEADIERVRRIQRLTQDLGVNLAGVEVILRLLDQIEEYRKEMERELENYVKEVERRISAIARSPHAPVPTDGSIIPVPKFRFRKPPEV